MTDTSTTTTPPATTTDTTTPPPASASTATPPAQDTSEHFVPQKDVERILGERLGRERAKFEREYEGKIEDAKKIAREETAKGFQTRLVNSSAKSIARELGFHDVDDALAAVDPAKLPIKDDEVDEDALKKAIEAVVEKKPYLVKSGDGEPKGKAKTPPAGKPKLPEGNPSGGGDGGGGKLKAAEALRQLRAQSKH